MPVLLAALEIQSYRDFEVIVVVDGSTDGTVVLKDQQWQLSINWVVQKNKGRSGTRNRGASEARGRYLLFLDDDTIPEPYLVEGHLTHHRKVKGSVLVGNVPLRFDRDSDFNHFRKYLEKKWLKDLPDSASIPIPKGKPFITAANFSIGYNDFNEAGGFDESLSDAEDYDLARRLVQKGTNIFFDKNLIAWHNDKVDMQQYIMRLQEYHQSRKLVVNDSRQLSQNQLPVIKSIVYGLLCHNFIYSGFVNEKPWTRLIPPQLRYRMMDIIVTGYSTIYRDRPL